MTFINKVDCYYFQLIKLNLAYMSVKLRNKIYLYIYLNIIKYIFNEKKCNK